MRLAALQRLELKTELQAAIDNGQLVPHYQPIVELETDRPTGSKHSCAGNLIATGAGERWTRSGLAPPRPCVKGSGTR
jgi:hypothetical protein